MRTLQVTKKQKENSDKSKLEYLIKYISKDFDCYLATRLITIENKNNL